MKISGRIRNSMLTYPVEHDVVELRVEGVGQSCQGHTEPCAQGPDICREHLDIHTENYLTVKYKKDMLL